MRKTLPPDEAEGPGFLGAIWQQYSASHDPVVSVTYVHPKTVLPVVIGASALLLLMHYIPQAREFTGFSDPWTPIAILLAACVLSLTQWKLWKQQKIVEILALFDTGLYCLSVIFVMLDCSSPVKYAWGLIYAQMAVTYGGLIAFSWPTLLAVAVVPFGVTLWLGMGDWGMIALTLFGALMFVVTSAGTARAREVKRQKERFQSAYLVTDRVAGESLDLALASTIAELGHFLHEMRNTLTTLRPNLGFLKMEDLSDDGKEALEAAMQSGDRSTEIVERLMKTIKQRTGVGKGRFVLPEVLTEKRIQNLTPAKGIRVDLQGELPDFEVAGNPEHLEAALHNLVSNAVQAGARSIGISGTYDGGLRRAIIRIRDDGPGIPEESRDDIFDPTKASAKGTGHGLGLPISKRLVELLGGDLTLDASGPDGTTFQVRLAGKHRPASTPPDA